MCNFLLSLYIIDKTLHQSDIRKIVKELYEVRAKSRMLGLVLGLPKSTVEAIHMQWRDPADQLLQVIAEFLQKERPTWRVIINALMSPVIREHALARKIEAKYTQNGEKAMYNTYLSILHWIPRSC